MLNNNCYCSNEPPNEREPVSPIKILAEALYQRKPKQEPTTDPQRLRVRQRQGYIEFVNTQKKSCFLRRNKLM